MRSPKAHNIARWLACLSIGTLLIPALGRGQSADRIGSLYEKMSWRGIGPAAR